MPHDLCGAHRRSNQSLLSLTDAEKKFFKVHCVVFTFFETNKIKYQSIVSV